MSALQDNVDALRKQLAKQEALLEQQKREAIEKEEGSWEFNMGVLQNTAKDKEQKLLQNKYSKSCFASKIQDREIVPFLKACVNCFKHLDEHMDSLESEMKKMYTELDDRLTHIEQFLIDDIKKEEFLENKPQSPHLSQNYKTTKLTCHQPTPIFTTSTLLGGSITYSNANTGLSLETREAMRD